MAAPEWTEEAEWHQGEAAAAGPRGEESRQMTFLPTPFHSAPVSRGKGRRKLWSPCHSTLGIHALPLPSLRRDRVTTLDLALLHLFGLRGSALQTSITTDFPHLPQGFFTWLITYEPNLPRVPPPPAQLQTVCINSLHVLRPQHLRISPAVSSPHCPLWGFLLH